MFELCSPSGSLSFGAIWLKSLKEAGLVSGRHVLKDAAEGGPGKPQERLGGGGGRRRWGGRGRREERETGGGARREHFGGLLLTEVVLSVPLSHLPS